MVWVGFWEGFWRPEGPEIQAGGADFRPKGPEIQDFLPEGPETGLSLFFVDCFSFFYLFVPFF